MDLQDQCDQQLKRFEAQLTDVYLEHDKLLEKMHSDFTAEREQLDEDKRRLSEKIEKMLKKHMEDRVKVENQKWDEIEALKEKNKEELADKIDKGMQEKASLTLIINDFRERNNRKIQFQNTIDELDKNLKEQMETAATKKAQLKSQFKELHERDHTIDDKNVKISDLYKRTQELEKFKFVLDYKIKELKREIGPRETAIQELNE